MDLHAHPPTSWLCCCSALTSFHSSFLPVVSVEDDLGTQASPPFPHPNVAQSALREASEANALSGSDEHVIQGEAIICSLVCFIPLDIFCSTVDPVSLQEMKMFPAWSSVGTAAFQGAGLLMRSVALQTSVRWANGRGCCGKTEEPFLHS